MALGIGYGLPFVAQHGTNPYKTQWAAAREGAKGAGASVEDENAGTGSCLVSRGQDVYTDGLPFTPSLLIVPQFYKDGNLYQDVPPFVAEDTTMRFTVSRNTTATRVTSSGLIESVASGVPRIDWLGQSCPALLVEASGTNLVLQSEAFTLSANWNTSVNGRTLVTGNVTATLDPYGGNEADLLSDDNTASSTHRMYTTGNVSITSGTTYSTSFFVKANTTPWFEIRLQQSNETDAGIVGTVFNLTSGTITSGSGTIQNYGNGWYRCTNIGTSNFTGNGRIFFYVYDSSGTKNYNGTSSNSLYIFGAQLEVGSVATTYIPTTSGAVSRAADVISASGALVSGLIGQTEGTIYAEVDLRNWIASGRILTCSNGTSNERIMIQVGANRTLQAIVTTASADVVDISTASGQVNGVYKCALTYASGDFAFYVNGTQIGTDSSGGVPACTSVFLGKIGTSASTNFLNDRIRAAALYTTRLSNDQLAELTRL